MERNSFEIRAIVCDLGNHTLRSELKGNFSCANPFDSSRAVYICPDSLQALSAGVDDDHPGAVGAMKRMRILEIGKNCETLIKINSVHPSYDNRKEEYLNLESIHEHPNYTLSSNGNDITIIKLVGYLKFSDGKPQCCVATEGQYDSLRSSCACSRDELTPRKSGYTKPTSIPNNGTWCCGSRRKKITLSSSIPGDNWPECLLEDTPMTPLSMGSSGKIQ
ncbi:unnamed protein product [Lepeophtheirus salmonis]|uniref:(salmon louse) hypothetical protein n=1 Tax=Lepeophtheirus salmonis TaxID=72036 RepID=A0A817FB95_LEPSM|nr:unnamed protein product [Lepeophtheirus salmonis]CAG9476626.1 unnamed protein product [Lepeophtheirus salmonis]